MFVWLRDTPNRAYCEVRVGLLLCVRCGEDSIFQATTAERIGCSSSLSEDSTLNKDTKKHTHPCQYVRATQQHTQQAPDTNHSFRQSLCSQSSSGVPQATPHIVGLVALSHGNQQRLSSHLRRFQTSNTVSRDQTTKRQLHESQCECSSRVALSTFLPTTDSTTGSLSRTVMIRSSCNWACQCLAPKAVTLSRC